MTSLSLAIRTLPTGAIRPLVSNGDICVGVTQNPALAGEMDYYVDQKTRDLIIYLYVDPKSDVDIWGTELCPKGLYLVPVSERDETARILNKSFRLVATFRPEKRSWDESYGGVSIVVPYAVYAPYSTVYPDIFH